MITGEVVAEDWDKNNRVTKVAIKGLYQDEYVVEHNQAGKELFALIGKKVRARGKVRQRSDRDMVTTVSGTRKSKQTREAIMFERDMSIEDTENTRQYCKAMLTQTMDELLKERGKALDFMTCPDDKYADFTDQASLEMDKAFSFRIKEREGRLIKKIKAALARLENGTFGICEECGREIAAKRLKARPTATLCIECKQKQEDQERVRGL